MREEARRIEKAVDPVSQASDSGIDQQVDRVIQSEKGPSPNQACRRVNHAIISDNQVNDQKPPNPASDSASLNDKQATLEEDNLSDE